MTKAEFDEWLKTWDGKCPMCPVEPMKARRARCPMCQEWVTWTPDHPGHKFPYLGERWDRKTQAYVSTGKLVWRNPCFKPNSLAWLGHVNACSKREKYVETFYDTTSQPSD